MYFTQRSNATNGHPISARVVLPKGKRIHKIPDYSQVKIANIWGISSLRTIESPLTLLQWLGHWSM